MAVRSCSLVFWERKYWYTTIKMIKAIITMLMPRVKKGAMEPLPANKALRLFLYLFSMLQAQCPMLLPLCLANRFCYDRGDSKLPQ